MKSIALKLNTATFFIPSDGTGVFSIYNNESGTQLECYIKDKTKIREQLTTGDRIHFRLVSLDSDNVDNLICEPRLSEHDNHEAGKGVEGMEFRVNDRIICAPFMEQGAVNVTITVVRGEVIVDFGGITEDKILLDYYHGTMGLGDNVTVGIKRLEQISEPLNKRQYVSCNACPDQDSGKCSEFCQDTY
jgi:hypothetical protein